MQEAADHIVLGPDLRHVDAWIFDLDHTLYLMDEVRHRFVEERICTFVQDFFGIARDPAWVIQKRYLREFGSTLGGLVAHHGADPDAYHAFVNDIDSLALSTDLELRSGLCRLPGRRFVFTNNCGRFATQVLERLGVDDLFADIVDARAMNFIPKPRPGAYDALIERCDVTASRAALFDDSVRNLVPARALGMTTIWFNNGAGQSYWTIDDVQNHVDYQTCDLAHFLNSIRV